MPSLPRERSEGNIYHVYARGVGKTLLFEDARDRKYFLKTLGKRLVSSPGDLLAWCLMGNHYHLLAKMELESLSNFIGVTGSVYARYFNLRYDRTGHLFESRFGSQAVSSEVQLLCALRYIHRNPEKAGIDVTDSYPWSSYGAYVGRREIPGVPQLCSTELILPLFGHVAEFERFHRVPDDGRFEFIDTENSLKRSRPMPDSKAIEIGSALFGGRWREDLLQVNRLERNRRLRLLRQAGLSIRQLERLTGINRGVISAA